MKLKLSLRTEIVINILVLMVVAIVSVSAVVIKISEYNMVNMKIDRGSMIASLLLKGIESTIALDGKLNSEQVQALIDSYGEHGEMGEVYVVDSDYSVIASTPHFSKGEAVNDDKLINAMSFSTSSVDLKVTDSFVLFSDYEGSSVYAPVLFEGDVVGGLRAFFPLDELNKLLSRTRWLVTFFLVFDSLLLLVFGSFLLSRVVVIPLRKFVRVAEKISTGNFGQRVDYEDENEIGQLAESFNRMTASLEDHVGYLERANRELKQAQQELIRSEKLASVGHLAAGIAHEVGNPLGAVIGYMEMLVNGVDDEKKRSDYLSRMEKELKKIDHTMRELLDFSRPSVVEMRPVDVNHVVEDAFHLLSHQKRFKEIEVKKELASVPSVLADPNQLQQVIVNMMLNAADAMARGGVLTVSTEYREEKDIDDKTARRRRRDDRDGEGAFVRRGEELVKISVSDNGAGIVEKDLEKIFDPFFTTKESGKGTGLGLSVSQRIIESFHGRIDVFSEVGKGSRFVVSLPVNLDKVKECDDG